MYPAYCPSKNTITLKSPHNNHWYSWHLMHFNNVFSLSYVSLKLTGCPTSIEPNLFLLCSKTDLRLLLELLIKTLHSEEWCSTPKKNVTNHMYYCRKRYYYLLKIIAEAPFLDVYTMKSMYLAQGVGRFLFNLESRSSADSLVKLRSHVKSLLILRKNWEPLLSSSGINSSLLRSLDSWSIPWSNELEGTSTERSCSCGTEYIADGMSAYSIPALFLVLWPFVLTMQ